MLQRTLEKQGPKGPLRISRSALIWGAALSALAVSYMFLPEPGPELRPATLDDASLLQMAQSLSMPSPAPISDPEMQAKARLGRVLFFDQRLSAQGDRACASCHVPVLQFTDGKQLAIGNVPLTRNTPSLLNAGLNHWFHWDGRVDSLASQALKPLEDPREHAISRSFVVGYVMKNYASAYEQAFGKLPPVLQNLELPQHAIPAQTAPQLAFDAATYALSTLGSYTLLTDILARAQTDRLAPAMELSRRAMSQPLHDPAWYDAWDKLTEPVQQAINEVFANVGRALAQFERGIVALDAPFDRFVRRAADPARVGLTPKQLFDADFGEQEWSGFQLFAGDAGCILCHNGPNFTDQQFHNIGLAQGDQPIVDAGRAAGVQLLLNDPFQCRKAPLALDPQIVDSESCRELAFLDASNHEAVGAFKTPSLRNVDQTGPYMHDGRLATLAEVLDHYDRLAAKPAMGHREESLKPLNLTKEERSALIAFLRALRSGVRDLHQESVISERP